jgi:hypothetical protein
MYDAMQETTREKKKILTLSSSSFPTYVAWMQKGKLNIKEKRER